MSEFEGLKPVSEMTLIERMRNNLQPRGTAPVVGLQLNNRFFNKDFIDQCIDELEKVTNRAMVGELPNPLEKLAYTLLCDSAYIEQKNSIDMG